VFSRHALSAARLTALTLAALVMTPNAGAHTYTVQPGDSLASIGAANGVSAGAVARASGRALEAPLPIGAAVEVPATTTVPAVRTPGLSSVPSVVPVAAASGTAYLRSDAAAALAALRRASQARLGIDVYPAGPVSGWRSYPQQVALWRSFQAGTGPLAAPPGTSAHESGTAVDLADPLMLRAVSLLGATYGWQKVEAPGEWWHINYVGG
jgi:D-alanyl-D-alanine carboxypeptidase